MVDAIISFAVQRLGDFVIKEAFFLHGVKEEVTCLKDELKWMQSLLRDAEEKQDSDERIHLWITEVRDIALSTQDVLDTFYLKIKETVTSKRGMLNTPIKKCYVYVARLICMI